MSISDVPDYASPAPWFNTPIAWYDAYSLAPGAVLSGGGYVVGTAPQLFVECQVLGTHANGTELNLYWYNDPEYQNLFSTVTYDFFTNAKMTDVVNHRSPYFAWALQSYETANTLNASVSMSSTSGNGSFGGGNPDREMLAVSGIVLAGGAGIAEILNSIIPGPATMSVIAVGGVPVRVIYQVYSNVASVTNTPVTGATATVTQEWVTAPICIPNNSAYLQINNEGSTSTSITVSIVSAR